MNRINETGALGDEDESSLGEAIAEAIDDFGPDFDAEGNPLEEGESDRVRERRPEPEAAQAEEAAEEQPEEEREPEEVPV